MSGRRGGSQRTGYVHGGVGLGGEPGLVVALEPLLANLQPKTTHLTRDLIDGRR